MVVKLQQESFLLGQIKPDMALISSGRWNAWNFPHPTVIERLNRYQSAVEKYRYFRPYKVKFY